jgi:hypothetical protein
MNAHNRIVGEIMEKVEYYNLMSEEEQMNAIKKNPHIIMYITNLTKEMKMEALRQNGLLLADLNEASNDEEMQLKAMELQLGLLKIQI